MRYILILLLTASVSFADADADANMKKQCKHQVYGNGQFDAMTAGVLIGLVKGIYYVIPKEMLEDNIKQAGSVSTIVDKVCQNALNNISNYGFEDDFKWEAIKMISKEFN